MQENADQKNSEYGHFSRSIGLLAHFIPMIYFYTSWKQSLTPFYLRLINCFVYKEGNWFPEEIQGILLG